MITGHRSRRETDMKKVLSLNDLSLVIQALFS